MAEAGIGRPATAVIPGLLTLLLAVGFVGIGGWQAYTALTGDGSWTPSARAANERRAIDHLKRIVLAQQAFQKKHPRGEYARFTAHLWQWVDPHGNPARLDLVSRRLAMAMGPTQAVDGYYFVEVRSRSGMDRISTSPIDYRRQWAVAALPASFGKSGRIVFLADQTDQIYALAPPRPPTVYPEDPVKGNWIVVDDPDALSTLQESFSPH
jgi:hypothetical protein